MPLFFSPMLVGCFNTQPPEGGCSSFCTEVVKFALFQHTAARRRLPLAIFSYRRHQNVSTHSRPKAAAQEKRKNLLKCVFQHTAARRRLPTASETVANDREFQHTAARRRLCGFGLDCLPKIQSFNTQPPEGGCSYLPLNGN